MRASRARARGQSVGCCALEPREERGGEDVEGERGGYRIAGSAHYGRALGGPEHHRVPGLDRHAVHRQGADLGHHGRGVVVAPGARAGDNHHEVGLGRRLPHGRGDPLGVVRHDRVAHGPAADPLGLRREHQRVGIGQVARAQLAAERADLVAGRDDCHHGGPPHDELRGPRRAGRGHVDRPQAMACRQQQLGRAHVLADRPHVLIRGGRSAQLHTTFLQLVHLLAHHHGVEGGGQRVARVDHLVRVRLEPRRRRLACADGVLRTHGNAVHRRRVERGRRACGPDRLRQHPPDRLLERHSHCLDPRGAAGRRAGLVPGGERLGGGNVVDEGCGARLSDTASPRPHCRPAIRSRPPGPRGTRPRR